MEILNLFKPNLNFLVIIVSLDFPYLPLPIIHLLE